MSMLKKFSELKIILGGVLFDKDVGWPTASKYAEVETHDECFSSNF